MENRLLVIRPPQKAPYLGGMLVQKGKCPYYADKRPTQTAFTLPRLLTASQYQDAMDMGMRRSGMLVYRPLCPDCRKCFAVRTRVADFIPSRSQRRVMKKCEGQFVFSVDKPSFSDEKLLLYQQYVGSQHGQSGQENDADNFRRFLIDTNVDTVELSWRDRENRLVAVGVLDITSNALSSVYFYWDMALSHFSLGVYSVLKEIDLARQMGLPYYYLGYLVPGVGSMEYKGNFAATEIWDGENWRALPARDMRDPAVVKLLDEAERGAVKSDADNFDTKKGIEVTLY